VGSRLYRLHDLWHSDTDMPVLGVFVPQYYFERHDLFLLKRHGFVRWAEKPGQWAAGAQDGGLPFVHLLPYLLDTKLAQVRVRPGVVADLVTIAVHPGHQAFIPGDVFPYQKERSRHMCRFKLAQYLRSRVAVWPVVERQSQASDLQAVNGVLGLEPFEVHLPAALSLQLAQPIQLRL
jgi:hypothetical protein